MRKQSLRPWPRDEVEAADGRLVRLFVASLTVLAPLAPREVFGNAANVHSLFLWALFWVLLLRPRQRARWFVRAGFMVGIATQVVTTLVWSRRSSCCSA